MIAGLKTAPAGQKEWDSHKKTAGTGQLEQDSQGETPK
jgi:hypothetical protein